MLIKKLYYKYLDIFFYKYKKLNKEFNTKNNILFRILIINFIYNEY